MDYLDLQLLKRFCKPGTTCMNEHEEDLVVNILVFYFLSYVDVDKVLENLHKGGYITKLAFQRIILNKDESEYQNAETMTMLLCKRVGFVALLWSLCTSGYVTVADVMLKTLSGNCSLQQMAKLRPTMSSETRGLVSKLKALSDTKFGLSQSLIIRKLSMRTKEKLMTEKIPNRKAILADRYFAMLSVELDNATFLQKQLLSVKALCKEIERIIPHTTNPALNEALYISRKAETNYICGCPEESKELMTSALGTMLNTELCPEQANIFYQQLNVLLRDYERSPCLEKKKHYLQLGSEGLRIVRSLDEPYRSYFLVSFTQRLAMCALDISISGKPINSGCESSCLELGQCYLQEIGQCVPNFGIRRYMLYILSNARLNELTGNIESAISLLENAQQMAKDVKYLEEASIKDYIENLTQTLGNQRNYIL